MASFMLEQLKDGKWDSRSFDQRFDSEMDAEEYRRRIVTQWNIADPIRVVPSADAPSCKMAGGPGNRHLEYFTPSLVQAAIRKALEDAPCLTIDEIAEKAALDRRVVADEVHPHRILRSALQGLRD
jgi:hypothetical protein